ncbi:hypothetical protein J5N97_010086 [Dioscorea zingiberensis]|uniref:Protein PHLOEM PROTEIN 2-LIKE A10 n=1 Tax=Dioscorea zingiberensis TaxID=325984 RepID=A0A9D5CY39_9LILI|nr:hypothetical protein J5N97_010086 [Dioscorea zingiberensis]
MATQLAEAALDFSRRRRRWILAAAAGYAVYRAYHLPSVAARRRKLAALLRALASLANAVASSAETLALVSSEINLFLGSDSSDLPLPPSLVQLSKVVCSDEVSASVSRISEAVTVGVVRGLSKTSQGSVAGPNFSDRVLDKLFSDSGKGFASLVVGSFARNLVLGFYSSESGDKIAGASRLEAVPEWVHLICGDKFRNLIADCIQRFVSTAVTVYLDKTMEINTYDELFSGLTNPKHETKLKDILVSLCNGAVETLVRTSHHVITTSESSSSVGKVEGIRQEEEALSKLFKRNSFHENVEDGDGGGGGWVDKVSSTLAIPRGGGNVQVYWCQVYDNIYHMPNIVPAIDVWDEASDGSIADHEV